MVEILPSILSADFARLGEQIATVENAGARILHIDVMDGHFVPNITLGPLVVRSIRKITAMELNVHLMIEDPEKFAPMFIEAGADHVLVHQESTAHLHRVLKLIQEHGARAGVVLNPATPVSTLEDVIDFVDIVLVMSVNPGFEAQTFIPRSLDKIRQLDRIRRDERLQFDIEIDGGVSAENTAQIVRAGCNLVVAGSAVFHSEDPAATVRKLRQAAAEADSVAV